MNLRDHRDVDAGDLGSFSICDPIPILVGHRLGGDEVWATVAVADDSALILSPGSSPSAGSDLS
jgi:hypothetical protein